MSVCRIFIFKSSKAGIEQMEEIVLVTSTRSWASVVFFEGRANGHISFGVRVHVDNDVRLVSLTRERSRRDRLRSCGPYGIDL
jgi:hypothetical protein